MKYLITPSLLGSFLYYKNSQEEWEEKALQDLLKSIRKEKSPTTEAQQRGIDFKESIRLYSEKRDVEYLNSKYDLDTNVVIERISNIVCFGLWQQAVKKDINVRNQDFLLYDKCDVIKEDTIYNIKTPSSYEIGKYNGSMQHLIYMHCTDIHNFSYLICENLKEYYREDYNYNKDSEDKIKECINEFLSFLDTCEEAKKEYFEKWKCL